MGVPSWFDDPDAWDRVEINGFEFAETKVDVDGDFGNDFDIKKAPGADGATLTNKGVEPIKPQLKWELWKLEHFEIYEAMLPKVYPYPGKTPLPLLTIIHPQFQLLKKSQFRLARLHTLKKVGPQIMQAQFDLVEYFAASKTPPKPKTVPDEKYTRERRQTYDPNFFRLPSKELKPGEGSNIIPPKPT
jgi:hypothetical protein